MIRLVIVAILFAAAAARADGPFTMGFEELADGVWSGVREDAPRFPVMGNTVFVIGDSGVVVFDGGGMPKMSELVIDKIRSLTDRPVTHVVISHWHGDHFFGVYRFAEEYPGVEFVAHEFTRDVINSSRINYVDRERGFLRNNFSEFQKIIETGVDSEGNEHGQVDRDIYRRIIDDADEIEEEFLRAKVLPPSIVMTDAYDIDLGNRVVQLRHLGHANTAGDIVMWLPNEKIVATGDAVVLPSPYAFNVPPRKWATTLRAINALDYDILVPGHGAVQRNSAYVDLLIESAESIADQRDALIAEGKTGEEVEAGLDFSAVEQRFVRGDEYVRVHYESWFEQPFRKAALKAITGEPMVEVPPPESVAFDDEAWQIEASEHAVVEYLGRPALRLKGGSATLADLDIKNGLVEFDIAVTEARGFAGLMFRLQDSANYENFYIRPHQSGNPDANQYQPVYNGRASWQLYHGDGYAAPVTYRFNEWIPVKILFAGGQAAVYIDSDDVLLHVPRLKRDERGGALGLSAADFTAVHFADFRYTELADVYEFPPAPIVSREESVIPSWAVSDAFSVDELDGVVQLNESHTAQREWRELHAEPSGIVNLAKAHSLRTDGDTVFATTQVNVDDAVVKELALGYSDKAAVYVNGRLVYRGDNTYRTRDYRYLGTIGFFDSVVVPLEKGNNEICIAVTEAFGGWGLMGKLSTLSDTS